MQDSTQWRVTDQGEIEVTFPIDARSYNSNNPSFPQIARLQVTPQLQVNVTRVKRDVTRYALPASTPIAGLVSEERAMLLRVIQQHHRSIVQLENGTTAMNSTPPNSTVSAVTPTPPAAMATPQMAATAPSTAPLPPMPAPNHPLFPIITQLAARLDREKRQLELLLTQWRHQATLLATGSARAQQDLNQLQQAIQHQKQRVRLCEQEWFMARQRAAPANANTPSAQPKVPSKRTLPTHFSTSSNTPPPVTSTPTAAPVLPPPVQTGPSADEQTHHHLMLKRTREALARDHLRLMNVSAFVSHNEAVHRLTAFHCLAMNEKADDGSAEADLKAADALKERIENVTRKVLSYKEPHPFERESISMLTERLLLEDERVALARVAIQLQRQQASATVVNNNQSPNVVASNVLSHK